MELQRHYGLEVAKAAGLPSGSLYPILARLEQQGWLTSDWERVDPHQTGRPRRRYYQLTHDGATGAGQALAATVERLSPQPGPGCPVSSNLVRAQCADLLRTRFSETSRATLSH